MVADDGWKTGGRKKHLNIRPRKDPIKSAERSMIDGKPPECSTRLSLSTIPDGSFLLSFLPQPGGLDIDFAEPFFYSIIKTLVLWARILY